MTKAKKVLLADDDSDDREVFTETLAAIDPGIVCHCAEDGRQALQLLHSKEIGTPDVFFLDINMPVMDGWELLARLKSDSVYKHVPVIIYTTSSVEKDKKVARELGALCFVTKPNNFKSVKSLLKVVVHHLYNNSLQQAGPEIEQATSLNNA
jgi:CheY-like chemotaxis protein